MKRLALLFSVLALTACQTATAPSTPIQMEGVYGGILSYAGADFLAIAIDVTTTTDGSVSGYGAGTTDGSSFGSLSVRGNTRANGDVTLTLTDLAGDWIRLNGTFSGSRYDGSWTTNVSSASGTFRITHEGNTDTLSTLRKQSSESIRSFLGAR